MTSPIEEIKNRLDIVDLMGGYLKLQKAGVNYRAVCPFHSEKKPSLFISPARQIWKCFGCGAGGNIFDFIMKIDGVEFGDALRVLAQKAGVELKSFKKDPKAETERKRLCEICELSACFFERQLESKAGLAVKEYLFGRGANKESIKKWRIGYAPDSWSGLKDFLVERGYSVKEIEKAGLAIMSQNGSFYDRFRARIIFPVFDLNSQAVGFGGRVFGVQGDEVAKYMNTPNTSLYDKSRILYGLDKAKLAIRKMDFCILVEGYMDAIMVSQSDFQNVVAVSGTALTPYQLGILKRYSDNLYTAFDMDIAGDSATKRGMDLAQAQEFNIKAIVMPAGKDPADIVAQSPEEWKSLVGKASSILEFYFATTFSKINPETVEGKVEASKILLPVIGRIPNKIARSYWVQRLAEKLKIKEEDIEEELKKNKKTEFMFSNSAANKVSGPNKKTKNRKDLLEERIGALILKYPQYFNLAYDNYLSCFSEDFKMLLGYLKKNIISSPDRIVFSENIWKKEDGTEKFVDCVNLLWLEAEAGYNPLCGDVFEIDASFDPEREIKTCLRELENLEIKKELDEISRQIKDAENQKDPQKTEALIKKFEQLTRDSFEKDPFA